MARDTGAARHLACHDDLLQTGAAKAADGIVNDFVVFQRDPPDRFSRPTYSSGSARTISGFLVSVYVSVVFSIIDDCLAGGFQANSGPIRKSPTHSTKSV